MACSEKYTFRKESYLDQKQNCWPRDGNHILAQFDDKTVLVYQAFKSQIASFAVKNQYFGGDEFSFGRMSWIKTNFLWMMYRCGWATKKNQERVLAVRITREGFANILSMAWTAEYQKSHKLQDKGSLVRLQWDPDHSPKYHKMGRRAIQLGLKGEILKEYATQMIVEITDITDFVKEQYHILNEKGADHILVARERVYTDVDRQVAEMINLSDFDREDVGEEDGMDSKDCPSDPELASVECTS